MFFILRVAQSRKNLLLAVKFSIRILQLKGLICSKFSINSLLVFAVNVDT